MNRDAIAFEAINDYVELLERKIAHLECQVEYYRLDELTKLPLRKDFESSFQSAWNKGSHFHLILIDINGLHEINEDLGYTAGDKYIVKAVDRLIDCNPNGRAKELYRWGGDEFTILYHYDKEFHSIDIDCPSDIFTVATKCSLDYESKEDLFDATNKLLKKRKAEYYTDNNRRVRGK